MTLEEEITDLIPRARAVTKGSIDPLWDSIMDAEAWLKGGRTMVAFASRNETGIWLRDELQRVVSLREVNP